VKKINIVILSGAGISAESGLKTFRDSDGLWNNHRVEDVATPEAWRSNPKLVLDFYNHRRSELDVAVPNLAHIALADLEARYEVTVITQNVDDLHERGGSSQVLHLHGKLTQVRGEFSVDEVIEIGTKPIQLGDVNALGEQLRPNIVWFGEEVPLIMTAAHKCAQADVLLVIGTSLNVYPAAGLMDEVSDSCQIYLVDPKAEEISTNRKIRVYKEKAGTAVPALVRKLMRLPFNELH